MRCWLADILVFCSQCHRFISQQLAPTKKNTAEEISKLNRHFDKTKNFFFGSNERVGGIVCFFCFVFFCCATEGNLSFMRERVRDWRRIKKKKRCIVWSGFSGKEKKQQESHFVFCFPVFVLLKFWQSQQNASEFLLGLGGKDFKFEKLNKLSKRKSKLR